MVRILILVLGAVVILILIVVAVGYALPQNHVASVDAVIPAPPATVFARISAPEKYPEWRKDVSRVEVLSAEPLKWREHAGTDRVTFEVVERREPEKLVVRIADTDLPFGGTWTYELKPEGPGTRLLITERGEVYNPIFRFMSRFVFSPTATMEKYVAALKSAT